MTIRLCTLSDLKQLQALSIHTFKLAYEHLNDPTDFQNYLDAAFSTEQLQQEMLHPNSFFFFAMKEEKIAGYLKLNIDQGMSDKSMDADFLEVERIYVAPQNKRQGIGQMLIEFSKEEAQRLGKKGVWLGVWGVNTAAIEFYKAQDFKKVGEHIFSIGGDDQADDVMRLTF